MIVHVGTNMDFSLHVPFRNTEWMLYLLLVVA